MAAGRAETVELQFVGRNRKAILRGNFLLQAFNVAVFEFDDFAAVRTNEMIMVTFVGNIIVLRLSSKMPGLGKARLAEQVHGAVNRGQPDVVTFLGQQKMHLVRSDVLHLQKGAEDDFALLGELELVFGEVIFERADFFERFIHSNGDSYAIGNELGY